MKKILIIAGVAFLVSLAAGAGGRMAFAPPPSEEAVAEAGDVAADGHGEAAANGHGANAAPDRTGAGAHASGTPPAGGHQDPGAAPGSAEPGGLGRPAGGAQTTHAPSADAPGPRGERPLEFREMGQILASMEPQEAGLFLSYLDDDRAMGLVRAMTVADAAEVLAHMPDARKASLQAKFMALLTGSE